MKALLPGLLFLVCVSGCANRPVNDKSAQAAFQAIEGRLLSASVLRVDYEVEARGAVAANITGDLVMQKPMLAAVNASGDFAGADVAPMLVSDGERMRGGVAPDYFEQEQPPDLRDGMLIGLLRMGILHNLATLTQGSPPEGTDGRVRKWVKAKGFGWRPETRSSQGSQLRGISFMLEVGGEPAGDVVLWYDEVSGLPVEREQVVHFDNGDMHVSERYAVEIDRVVGPCRFDLDSIALTD